MKNKNKITGPVGYTYYANTSFSKGSKIQLDNSKKEKEKEKERKLTTDELMISIRWKIRNLINFFSKLLYW